MSDGAPSNPAPYQTWVDSRGVKRIFNSADGLWYIHKPEEELTLLRDRVKELEQKLEEAQLKAAFDDEAWRSRGRTIEKLEQRLEALESTQNRKGPKFGEGLKVSDLSSPWVDYGPVKMPPEFQHFTSGTTLPPKCAQCGRLL